MSLDNYQKKYLEAMGLSYWEVRPGFFAETISQTTGSAESVEAESTLSEMSAKEIDTTNVSATPARSVLQADAEIPIKPNMAEKWEMLARKVSHCQQCELHKTRSNTVFGVGNHAADCLVIGEAPGADEDRQGEPFVGRAGKLLDEMLFALGFKREQVFIANILKCRPPNNRDPRAEEVINCNPFLQQQIKLIMPKVILSVGRISAQNLLKSKETIGRLRGKTHYFGEQNIPLIATYHPAYLLRSPLAKRKSWQDLLQVLKLLHKQ